MPDGTLPRDRTPKTLPTAQAHLFGLLVFVAGVVSMATTAAAADGAPSAFQGVWRHSPGAQEEQLRVQAIETATKDLGLLVRDRARQRLNERTTPASELKLLLEGDRLEISRQGNSLVLRLGAEPILVQRDGDEGRLSARVDGQTIVVTSQDEQGSRVTTYALSPDGKQLTLSVRLTGSRLSSPLIYRSTYVRK
ncbi:MAG: hypothetical protein IPG45_35675 [Deltaproteobacteria bacterium]|nr:hypothetical protein [Deltaproteobacteria bacterium]